MKEGRAHSRRKKRQKGRNSRQLKGKTRKNEAENLVHKAIVQDKERERKSKKYRSNFGNF